MIGRLVTSTPLKTWDMQYMKVFKRRIARMPIITPAFAKHLMPCMITLHWVYGSLRCLTASM